MFNIKRELREKIAGYWMVFCLALVVVLPFIIGVGLYIKSTLLFESCSVPELLFSGKWMPREGNFGFLTFIVSSLWVTVLAVLISAPVCLLTAIFLTQYAKRYYLTVMHPVVDILAGIPSVIYGVWGILVIVPFISNDVAPLFGVQTSGYNILSGAVVLSVMIIPFILNILIEVFRSIPIELTEASLALGASKWVTIKRVLVKKAIPGILSATGLGVSRAFGETIAVLMVVGNVVNIPKGIFDAGYPLPALIANNYGELLSIPKYDAALMFAALILFAVVLIFNLLSRITIARFEKSTL